MCMTVVSTKDYGPSNDSQFDGEQDTIAIVYHQCQPFVSGGFEIDDCDEREANARLIAAAPELIEAASEAVASGCPCPSCTRLRAAIAGVGGAK